MIANRQTALIATGSVAQLSPPAEQSLTVTALPCRATGVLVLRVAGEIDLATVEQLREHLHRYRLSAHRGMVLDCTEVSFLAACGIGVLVDIADQARAAGVPLRLVTQRRAVLRALEAGRATDLVARHATVAEAVAQCSI